MARIQIKDLPQDIKISKKELQMILGAYSSSMPGSTSFAGQTGFQQSFYGSSISVRSLYELFKHLHQAWPYV